jgi:hypothetical protein
MNRNIEGNEIKNREEDKEFRAGEKERLLFISSNVKSSKNKH